MHCSKVSSAFTFFNSPVKVPFMRINLFFVPVSLLVLVGVARHGHAQGGGLEEEIIDEDDGGRDRPEERTRCPPHEHRPGVAGVARQLPGQAGDLAHPDGGDGCGGRNDGDDTGDASGAGHGMTRITTDIVIGADGVTSPRLLGPTLGSLGVAGATYPDGLDPGAALQWFAVDALRGRGGAVGPRCVGPARQPQQLGGGL